ncbi:ATP-binding protein [Eleftheria terrae]|uniref:ATP-binding protein n=1 Tax=Eleftheria terrae TaxID=1597781 RepID=UPI00263A4524|nr:ATP-binding protein [Eleftheria terrae]WKB50755.1 ATP-binding protein [Eleftheria terrae]
MSRGTRNAPPRASAMLQSLRGLGYSTGSALADIVDNSISAGAREVRIDFAWSGPDSRISILDDGDGMTDSQLESAMTLGDKSPVDSREPQDLGRFGLGLKTASFSQCRRLTVASVVGPSTACLRWDLDQLAASADGGWLLFEGPATGSEPFLVQLSGRSAGTLVLWEAMDRIVTPGYTADDFNDMIDGAERHLAMVFHRLLGGPRRRLRLLINGRPVLPWDPFMSGHAAKPWASPIARMPTDVGKIEVECHVLPHKDQLTAEEFEAAAGPEGWTAQQGFYVYRNERLLLAGGWLGLGQGRAWNREEAHRLARIRLDIPNTADTAWRIDIRKSTARPPVTLRPWLTRLAEDTRARARKVFAYRGAPATGHRGVPLDHAWRAEHSRSGVKYRIDERHPAIAAVLDGSGPQATLVRAMLRVIEETVPVQRIWLDTAENRETPRTAFAGEPPKAVIEALFPFYEDMVKRRGMSAQAAKRTLLGMEPFQNYPALVDGLPDELQ